MMKAISVFLLNLSLYANIFAGKATVKSMEIKGDFANTKQCIRCHLDIYEEYKNSPHFNSTIFRDEIHKKIFKAHIKSTNETRYICSICHSPLVKNNSINNMNQEKREYKEAISCAYCHRIKSIQKHKKVNKNIILNKKGVYYGTRNPQIRSEYHKIINTNIIHKNGDTCMGCHSHKENSNGFVVCKTQSSNSLKENCITCHMPQVEGSLSDRIETFTHAFHGFAGVSNSHEKLKKYLIIKLKKDEKLKISLHNLAPHSFLLHPMRMAELEVKVIRDGKCIKIFKKRFLKVLGKDKKPAPPWLAKEIIKDNMIKAKEEKEIEFDFKLKKDDKVEAIFKIYNVNPEIAKKFNIKFKIIEFKKETFKI